MRITLTNDRQEKIRLSDLTKGYRIKEIRGLSPADADIATTEYALSNGSMVTNRRIPKRNIVIDFCLSTSQAEEVKLDLYEKLHTAERLRFDYETKNISAYADGILETFDARTWQGLPAFQLSLICPDPYFYDTEETVGTYSRTTDGFQFPLPDGLAVPESGIPFSTVTAGRTIILQNHGAETGLTVQAEFSGKASFFQIKKVETDELLTIGFNFRAGDVLTIVSTDSEKSVTVRRTSETINAINGFVIGSEWLTMSRGRNSFEIHSDGLTSVRADINFRERYSGV